MEIGIKETVDIDVCCFYNQKYDVLPTPDSNNETRLLKAKHGLKILGDPYRKVCRCCGKKEPEVSFKKIAHAFPEAIGNKALATYYECDVCNDFFGRTIENDYCNYFSLFHSVMVKSGKGGKRECKFKVPCEKRTANCSNSCVRIEYINNNPCIYRCENVSEKYVELKDNCLKISKKTGKCCLIAVFKTLVKMAITVMPEKEIHTFSNVIKWILEEEHNNYYISKPLLIRYQMIPGFNVTRYPHFVLYRRKSGVLDVPYMLFQLTYSCFSLLIEVPNDYEAKCISNLKFATLPFPYVPFYTSEEGVWNMSETGNSEGDYQRINLSFDGVNVLHDNNMLD